MTDKIEDQPDGATPLDDISGLLRKDITTRQQLDEAETLFISTYWAPALVTTRSSTK